MHYYRFHIGDYAAHTQHLEPLEDIAYRRMIDWCYLNESPLPRDVTEISRLIRMQTHCECIETVLLDFFDFQNDGYIQPRIKSEISEFRAKSEKAKKSANARWTKEANKNAGLTDANAMRAQCERNANREPLTTNREPLTIDPLPEDSRELKFAHEMFKVIKIRWPKRKPPNFESWAKDIGLAVRIDKRTIEQLWRVFKWAVDDDFWSINIRSPRQIRKHFDELEERRENRERNKPAIERTLAERIANPDW